MCEILFLCGNNNSATIASLKVLDREIDGKDESSKDEVRTDNFRHGSDHVG